MMTSADLDHNDKLAVEKKEKLEWVTPKMMLMDTLDTHGNKPNAYMERPPAVPEDGPS